VDEVLVYQSSNGADSLFLYFSQFLETICDLLYDDLRPRILHETRLTALCEVCAVLQAFMVLDASAITPTSTIFSTSSSSNAPSDAATSLAKRSTPSDDLLPSSSHPRPKNKVGKRLHISHLLQIVLQDAQMRLFFKAQAAIHYVPKAEELAWPEILVCEFRSCLMFFFPGVQLLIVSSL
jgi:hypothetical protein